MKRIYADNAALTPIDKKVIQEMRKYESEEYGNPSSLYIEGVRAKKAVENARKRSADFLAAHADEIVFTGSGTEANNLAIFGSVERLLQQGKSMQDIHIVTSVIEHPSVLECVRFLEGKGAKVDYVSVTEQGIVDIKELRSVITPQTSLVSIMYVNNEIGTIQPIQEIAKIIRFVRKSKGEGVQAEKYPLFHVDASQAALYLDMNVERLGVDLLTLDAHKVYGPRGIGLLYVRRKVEIEPIIQGGGQESNRRSGTPNVPSIMGFAKALELAELFKEKEKMRLTILRDYCIDLLLKQFPDITLNGDRTVRIPNNVNISIPDSDTEFLVIQLDAQGVACSTKSSCLRDEEESYVIAALRSSSTSEKKMNSRLKTIKNNNSLRFSFGKETTKKDIEYILQALRTLLKK